MKKDENPKVSISYCNKCKNAIRVAAGTPSKEFYKEVEKLSLGIRTTTLNKYRKNPPELFKCECL